MKVTIADGMEFEAVVNGFTPIAYARSFSVTKANGERRQKDISEAIEAVASASVPPILPLQELFYAFVKSADQSFSEPFDKWASSFPVEAYDMSRDDGWAADIMGLVKESFFRSAQSRGLEAAPAKKAASKATD